MVRIEIGVAEIVIRWPFTKIAKRNLIRQKTWLPLDVAYHDNKGFKISCETDGQNSN